MRLAVLAALPGCLMGGGPVLAVRSKSKVALGWETSVNTLAVGIEGGKTYGIGERDAGYAAFRYTAPLNPSTRSSDSLLIGIDDESSPHLNLMLGYGGPDGHNGLAAGAAPMIVLGDRPCYTESYLFTLTLGIRTLGGETELYVAPKGNVYVPLPCD